MERGFSISKAIITDNISIYQWIALLESANLCKANALKRKSEEKKEDVSKLEGSLLLLEKKKKKKKKKLN